MNIKKNYISQWSPSDKAPGNMLALEQAKERFAAGKYVGVMFSLHEKPLGWIRYGKSKTGPLECLIIYFDDSLDRHALLEFEGSSSESVDLIFYAASFYNSDGTYFRLFRQENEWTLSKFHGAQILMEDEKLYNAPVEKLAFEPFSERDFECFEIASSININDFTKIVS